MTETTNIYIAFPENTSSKKWLDELIEKIKTVFSRITDAPINWIVESKATPDIDRDIHFYIIILDFELNENKEYQNKLEAISTGLQSDENKDFSRLFKVILTPEDMVNQPEYFKPVIGYNFFEYTKRKNTVSRLNFDEDSTKAWTRLLDLVFDLNESIEIKQDKKVLSNYRNRFVYLAHCSPDMIHIRDDIKRELQHFGFRVVPKFNVFDNYEDLSQIIKKNLQFCNYILQIIGGKYGSIDKGQKQSFYETENQLIREELQKAGNKKRIIWIPYNLKVTEQKQERYLSRIRQKESDQYTEVVETSINEFKNILFQELLKNNNNNLLKNSKCEIYLMAPVNGNIEPLVSAASSLKLNLKTLDYSLQSTLYKQHLSLLTNCDSIIILWENEDLMWLKSKIRDIIKAPGLGRKNPYKSITIISQKKPDLSDFDVWLPHIDIVAFNKPEEIKNYFRSI